MAIDDDQQPKHLDLPSKEELMEAVQKEGIVVYKRNDEEKREVHLSSGEDAFFALLATDMLDLAEKYRRNVDDVH